MNEEDLNDEVIYSQSTQGSQLFPTTTYGSSFTNVWDDSLNENDWSTSSIQQVMSVSFSFCVRSNN